MAPSPFGQYITRIDLFQQMREPRHNGENEDLKGKGTVPIGFEISPCAQSWKWSVAAIIGMRLQCSSTKEKYLLISIVFSLVPTKIDEIPLH